MGAGIWMLTVILGTATSIDRRSGITTKLAYSKDVLFLLSDKDDKTRK